ncbi:MAG: hypothetical protein AAGF12_29010 [Myxococcota bacterium]
MSPPLPRCSLRRALFSGLVLASVGCYASHERGDRGTGDGARDGSSIDASGLDALTDRTMPFPESGVSDGSSDGTTDGGAIEPFRCEAVNSVDVLFVIDNSGSAGGYRRAVRRHLAKVIEELALPRDLDGDGAEDWPAIQDANFGLTTTAVSDGDNCRDALDGRLRRGPVVDPECPAIYPAIVRYRPGDPIAEVQKHIECHGRGIVPGCSIEQPLEAMVKALLPARSPFPFLSGSGRGSTDNAGFLRPDSLLAVVVVADEDDCSYEQPLRDPPDGDGGLIPPDAGLPPGICERPNALFPIERYVAALEWLRPRGNFVFVAVTGSPETFTYDRVGGELASLLSSPGMLGQYACASSDGAVEPGRRLAQVAEAVAPRSGIGSVCRLTSHELGGGVAGLVGRRACLAR